MTRSTFAILALAAGIAGTSSPVSAQDAPDAGRAETAAKPAAPLASMRLTGVPALLAHWPQTALGRLAAEPDVAEAAKRVIAYHVEDRLRRRAVLDAAIDLQLELEAWQVSNMLVQPDLWRVFDHPLTELRRFDFEAFVQSARQVPRYSILLACRPQFEGRWTQAFEAEAARMAASPWVRAVVDAKVGGFPAHVFGPPDQEQLDDQPWYDGSAIAWMQHLPGTFANGSGSPEAFDPAGAMRPDGEPGFALSIDLKAYLDLFADMGMPQPGEFVALGFDRLDRFEWRVSFDGELLLDELELVLSREPGGLIGAVLAGTGTPPPQALPRGGLAQLRAAVDFELLFTTIEEVSRGELALTTEIAQDLPKAFDGGFALGICAPAPGGLIPRVLLTLGIGDRAAFDRLLQQAIEDGMPVKQVEYDGLPCTLLEFDGVPQGIKPAFCVLDGRLHMAESGRSLRKFLAAQKSGDEAMDVGDAPIPAGPGEVLSTFDLRMDEAALYRAFHDVWLPLLALVPGRLIEPALERDDMPDVDLIEQHCGKSRGVLRRQGNRYIVQHLGALGGPELAAMLMTWGPFLSGTMANDYVTEELLRQVATRKLSRVWPALEAFQQREQRWPKDLGELFASGKLAADALLLPGDSLAEEFELADGSTARTSFRYFPEPAKIANQDTTALLVQIRPKPYGRPVLATDGSLPDIYSSASSQPIEQFGR